jgi:hypothetical protein
MMEKLQYSQTGQTKRHAAAAACSAEKIIVIENGQICKAILLKTNHFFGRGRSAEGKRHPAAGLSGRKNGLPMRRYNDGPCRSNA